ncbi:MAG TPA: hypothetical protein VFR41_14430, partial [Acidimicrobiia bacterium]|nr:hypothetical protein [Acidimicrobiia bacterium]
MIELEPTVRTLPQGANRRQAFRIEVTCAIDAFSERPVAGTDAWNVESDRRGRSLRTISEDVSISGVRMRLPAPLRAGTTLTLKIHID